ncbi:hypothetical protein EVAR_11191_1 [Eumeta japonica]|uniref:Uncharacterized protein n=1 Tax=Eumeta variegata TaxID=151549 RepID=A0A4C1U4I8_EUMVA|nr:hypothetical protein EVAR_11191_1 [Eumeta japonica]
MHVYTRNVSSLTTPYWVQCREITKVVKMHVYTECIIADYSILGTVPDEQRRPLPSAVGSQPHPHVTTVKEDSNVE